jgi:hypothetical protein
MDTNGETSILELNSRVQNIKMKTTSNRYEPKIVMEDKVYLETYYSHQLGSVAVNETLAKIKAHELQIVRWMLTKDQQLMKLNLETNAKSQLMKINA